MRYGKFCLGKELRNAAMGKKTKLPPELLVFLAVDRYPAIQKRIAKAFAITER